MSKWPHDPARGRRRGGIRCRQSRKPLPRRAECEANSLPEATIRSSYRYKKYTAGCSGRSHRWGLFPRRRPGNTDGFSFATTGASITRQRGVERAYRAPLTLVTSVPTAMVTAIATVSTAETTEAPRFPQFFQQLARRRRRECARDGGMFCCLMFVSRTLTPMAREI